MSAAALAILLAVIPEVPGLVAGLAGLFKKYPALTPEMIVAAAKELADQGNAAIDSMQAEIDAYRKAHPPTA
jgi:gamma-glutamyltranspeptidase